MTASNTVHGGIGEAVRRYRGERGWTLDELAERSSVSRRMLVSIEHGEGNPSIGRCCGSATRWGSAFRCWSTSSGRAI
jgi:transcriptional regulator with XRE-family HTH domain